MLKNLQIYKYEWLLIGLLFLPTLAFGQDLGSSNGLFNNSKTKTSSKAIPKKPVPKTKKTNASVKKAVPKLKTVTKTARKKTKATQPKKKISTTRASKSEVAVQEISKPQNSILITAGGKTNEDFDELFEWAIDIGNTARGECEHIKAEAAYLRAQSLKIKDSRVIYDLGNLYIDQRRWEEAERAYRAAIEFEPNSPEAHVALSFVLTQSVTDTNLAERYTEAEKLVRRAIEIEPKNAFAYDQLGITLELGGVFSQETQNAYRKAIELEPTFALAYAHLGRLLIKTGLADESSIAYQNAIEYSTDVPTMILVADVMQSQQKYTESEQLLRRAHKEDEKNLTVLFLLGRVLVTRGSYEEAEKVIKKSAEISPNSFVSYMLLGSMSMRREKFEDAEKYLMKAVKVVSPNEKKRLAQKFEAVADGFLSAGKNKDAARLFRQAALLDKEKTILADKLTQAQEK